MCVCVSIYIYIYENTHSSTPILYSLISFFSFKDNQHQIIAWDGHIYQFRKDVAPFIKTESRKFHQQWDGTKVNKWPSCRFQHKGISHLYMKIKETWFKKCNKYLIVPLTQGALLLKVLANIVIAWMLTRPNFYI